MKERKKRDAFFMKNRVPALQIDGWCDISLNVGMLVMWCALA